MEIIDVRKIKLNIISFSTNQVEKINSYIFDKDKKLAYASELLKIQFAKKKRIQISELRDAKKPYFRNVDWNFSISHCYPYCVFVAKKNKIGVDIEKIQKIQFENIAKRVFNNYENKILNKSNNKLLMFYKIWTMKESLYKCIFPKKSNKLFLKYKNNCFRNKDFVVNFKIWKKYLISTCEKIN